MGISPAMPPPMLMANGAWSHSARQAMPPGLMMPEDQQPMQPGAMLPFGGFRAEGGPIRPGRGYIVGERGPEMIVPQEPGMVLPNNDPQRSGPLSDRGPMGPQTGPLSMRGPTPSGRRYTPQRRLETAMRRGDERATQALFSAEMWGPRGRPGGMPMPGNTLPPPMRMPLPQPRSPAPMANEPGDPAPIRTTPGEEAPVISDPAATGMMTNPLQPYGPPLLVPRGFDAANAAAQNATFPGLPPPPPGLYQEEAPRLTMETAPGTNYGMPFFDGQPSKQLVKLDRPETTGYAPVQGVPGMMVPTGPGADKLPVMQQQENPGWSVKGQPKTTMTPVNQAPEKEPKPPTGIQYTYDTAGNVTGGFYPRWDAATGKFVITPMDMDGNGTVSKTEQAAAAAGAAAASARTTPSGATYKRL
jgi:hypothetical protein